MSPTELVREKALALLADPDKGLNPAFVFACQERQIPVPIAGDGGNPAAPFDFSPDSNQIFRMREDIEWLSRNSNQQYPCCVAYGLSANQLRTGRPKGSIFFGTVIIKLQFFLGWYVSDSEQSADFEAHMDALEQAVLVVLNQDCTRWVPVIYENLADISNRSPMIETNSGEILRRGMEVTVTAIAYA